MIYYPLIRGRQFDLLALAGLAKTLSPDIVPIIEPVKDLPALPRVAKAFAQARHPLYVIQNPQVGTYGLLEAPRHRVAFDGPWVQAARYFDAQPASLVIAATTAQLAALDKAQRVVVPDAARFRAAGHPQAIYLSDHYPTRAATEDYYRLQRDFYQYPKATLSGAGFADYPLSTHWYSETGYPQRAVALHLLYAENGMLYLRHFTSVNNADYQNPGAKFLEALAPLGPWLAAHPQAATPATAELLELYATRHFPGLGTVRRLQLSHFMTVMGRWLEA
ncbi:sce7725 family protein [Lacticaseibacillus kribbianus]|uniref:sce7725 family protein n=1 Tax=Lacticaseibacillus kribbianus TaxID=2926292 RepID=UPI001CD4D7DB|nr:sce7725 family protein [Lacticaseibacillus kribbianus]